MSNLVKEINRDKQLSQVVDKDTLAKLLYDVVIRRNGQLHFSDWTSLSKRVSYVLAYFEACPDAKLGLDRDEVFIIENFPQIRRSHIVKAPPRACLETDDPSIWDNHHETT